MYLPSNFSYSWRPTLPMMWAHTQLKTKNKQKTKEPSPQAWEPQGPLSSFSVPLKSSVHNMHPVHALGFLTPGPVLCTCSRVSVSPGSRLLPQGPSSTHQEGSKGACVVYSTPLFLREAQGQRVAELGQ